MIVLTCQIIITAWQASEHLRKPTKSLTMAFQRLRYLKKPLVIADFSDILDLPMIHLQLILLPGIQSSSGNLKERPVR